MAEWDEAQRVEVALTVIGMVTSVRAGDENGWRSLFQSLLDKATTRSEHSAIVGSVVGCLLGVCAMPGPELDDDLQRFALHIAGKPS